MYRRGLDESRAPPGEMGGSIAIGFDPNGGQHPAARATVLAWIADRFAGKPEAIDCKSG